VTVPYAHLIFPAIILIATAYLLIVFGFLVPQKIAQSNPEKHAGRISKLIRLISQLLSPVTFLIWGSAGLIAKIFGIKSSEINTTEEDVKAVVQEGLEGGGIEESEQGLVERIFSLDDRKIGSLITHKNDIVWIDVSTTPQELLAIIKKEPYSVYPVVDKDIDHIVGAIRLKDLVGRFSSPTFKFTNFIRPANFLTENISIHSVLENFKTTKFDYALIPDEFGSIQGIVTLSDIFEALVGDVSVNPSHEEYEITPRSDTSWLIDGQYPFYDFLEYFGLQDYYSEYPYNTLSGLILDKLEKMPHAGDKFAWFHFEIEVVDMDFARIDKVMVTDVGVPDNCLE
jgi:putative hemolysin